jgi:hypothetical protein
MLRFYKNYEMIFANKGDEIYFRIILTKKQAQIKNTAIRQSSWNSICDLEIGI